MTLNNTRGEARGRAGAGCPSGGEMHSLPRPVREKSPDAPPPHAPCCGALQASLCRAGGSRTGLRLLPAPVGRAVRAPDSAIPVRNASERFRRHKMQTRRSLAKAHRNPGILWSGEQLPGS